MDAAGESTALSQYPCRRRQVDLGSWISWFRAQRVWGSEFKISWFGVQDFFGAVGFRYLGRMKLWIAGLRILALGSVQLMRGSCECSLTRKEYAGRAVFAWAPYT